MERRENLGKKYSFARVERSGSNTNAQQPQLASELTIRIRPVAGAVVGAGTHRRKLKMLNINLTRVLI